MPGRTAAWRSSPATARVPGWTATILPCPKVRRTSACQPSGSSACSAKIAAVIVSLRLGACARTSDMYIHIKTKQTMGRRLMAAGGPSAGAKVWRNARLATLAVHDSHLGMVETGAVAADSGRIVYAGPEAGLPAAFAAADAEDCGGRLITPGLVDCHTHLVYAGSRANEFEM